MFFDKIFKIFILSLLTSFIGCVCVAATMQLNAVPNDCSIVRKKRPDTTVASANNYLYISCCESRILKDENNQNVTINLSNYSSVDAFYGATFNLKLGTTSSCNAVNYYDFRISDYNPLQLADLWSPATFVFDNVINAGKITYADQARVGDHSDKGGSWWIMNYKESIGSQEVDVCRSYAQMKGLVIFIALFSIEELCQTETIKAMPVGSDMLTVAKPYYVSGNYTNTFLRRMIYALYNNDCPYRKNGVAQVESCVKTDDLISGYTKENNCYLVSDYLNKYCQKPQDYCPCNGSECDSDFSPVATQADKSKSDCYSCYADSRIAYKNCKDTTLETVSEYVNRKYLANNGSDAQKKLVSSGFGVGSYVMVPFFNSKEKSAQDFISKINEKSTEVDAIFYKIKTSQGPYGFPRIAISGVADNIDPNNPVKSFGTNSYNNPGINMFVNSSYIRNFRDKKEEILRGSCKSTFNSEFGELYRGTWFRPKMFLKFGENEKLITFSPIDNSSYEDGNSTDKNVSKWNETDPIKISLGYIPIGGCEVVSDESIFDYVCTRLEYDPVANTRRYVAYRASLERMGTYQNNTCAQLDASQMLDPIGYVDAPLLKYNYSNIGGIISPIRMALSRNNTSENIGITIIVDPDAIQTEVQNYHTNLSLKYSIVEVPDDSKTFSSKSDAISALSSATDGGCVFLFNRKFCVARDICSKIARVPYGIRSSNDCGQMGADECNSMKKLYESLVEQCKFRVNCKSDSISLESCKSSLTNDRFMTLFGNLSDHFIDYDFNGDICLVNGFDFATYKQTVLKDEIPTVVKFSNYGNIEHDYVVAFKNVVDKDDTDKIAFKSKKVDKITEYKNFVKVPIEYFYNKNISYVITYLSRIYEDTNKTIKEAYEKFLKSDGSIAIDSSNIKIRRKNIQEIGLCIPASTIPGKITIKKDSERNDKYLPMQCQFIESVITGAGGGGTAITNTAPLDNLYLTAAATGIGLIAFAFIDHYRNTYGIYSRPGTSGSYNSSILNIKSIRDGFISSKVGVGAGNRVDDACEDKVAADTLNSLYQRNSSTASRNSPSTSRSANNIVSSIVHDNKSYMLGSSYIEITNEALIALVFGGYTVGEHCDKRMIGINGNCDSISCKTVDSIESSYQILTDVTFANYADYYSDKRNTWSISQGYSPTGYGTSELYLNEDYIALNNGSDYGKRLISGDVYGDARFVGAFMKGGYHTNIIDLTNNFTMKDQAMKERNGIPLLISKGNYLTAADCSGSSSLSLDNNKIGTGGCIAPNQKVVGKGGNGFIKISSAITKPYLDLNEVDRYGDKVLLSSDTGGISDTKCQDVCPSVNIKFFYQDSSYNMVCEYSGESKNAFDTISRGDKINPAKCVRSSTGEILVSNRNGCIIGCKDSLRMTKDRYYGICVSNDNYLNSLDFLDKISCTNVVIDRIDYKNFDDYFYKLSPTAANDPLNSRYADNYKFFTNNCSSHNIVKNASFWTLYKSLATYIAGRSIDDGADGNCIQNFNDYNIIDSSMLNREPLYRYCNSYGFWSLDDTVNSMSKDIQTGSITGKYYCPRIDPRNIVYQNSAPLAETELKKTANYDYRYSGNAKWNEVPSNAFSIGSCLTNYIPRYKDNPIRRKCNISGQWQMIDYDNICLPSCPIIDPSTEVKVHIYNRSDIDIVGINNDNYRMLVWKIEEYSKSDSYGKVYVSGYCPEIEVIYHNATNDSFSVEATIYNGSDINTETKRSCDMSAYVDNILKPEISGTIANSKPQWSTFNANTNVSCSVALIFAGGFIDGFYYNPTFFNKETKGYCSIEDYRNLRVQNLYIDYQKYPEINGFASLPPVRKTVDRINTTIADVNNDYNYIFFDNISVLCRNPDVQNKKCSGGLLVDGIVGGYRYSIASFNSSGNSYGNVLSRKVENILQINDSLSFASDQEIASIVVKISDQIDDSVVAKLVADKIKDIFTNNPSSISSYIDINLTFNGLYKSRPIKSYKFLSKLFNTKSSPFTCNQAKNLNCGVVNGVSLTNNQAFDLVFSYGVSRAVTTPDNQVFGNRYFSILSTYCHDGSLYVMDQKNTATIRRSSTAINGCGVDANNQSILRPCFDSGEFLADVNGSVIAGSNQMIVNAISAEKNSNISQNILKGKSELAVNLNHQIVMIDLGDDKFNNLTSLPSDVNILTSLSAKMSDYLTANFINQNISLAYWDSTTIRKYNYQPMNESLLASYVKTKGIEQYYIESINKVVTDFNGGFVDYIDCWGNTNTYYCEPATAGSYSRCFCSRDDWDYFKLNGSIKPSRLNYYPVIEYAQKISPLIKVKERALPPSFLINSSGQPVVDINENKNFVYILSNSISSFNKGGYYEVLLPISRIYIPTNSNAVASGDQASYAKDITEFESKFKGFNIIKNKVGGCYLGANSNASFKLPTPSEFEIFCSYNESIPIRIPSSYDCVPNLSIDGATVCSSGAKFNAYCSEYNVNPTNLSCNLK